MFCEKGVLGNFAKFTGKNLCQSLFFNKVAGAADIKPGSQESARCRSGICDQPVTDNDETKWLKKVERQLRGTVKKESISITNDK